MEMQFRKVAMFGGGCFWCMDAVFRRLRGVTRVASGYAGGSVPHPTYEQVCSGQTGAAEVVYVEFDPKIISYDDLLSVFFSLHDPTTLNRQGNDLGTQYRSVVYFWDTQQEDAARAYVKKLTDEGTFANPIVTVIEPAVEFTPAESYHQDYYAKNPEQGYCQVMIDPKIAKLRKSYQHLLRD